MSFNIEVEGEDWLAEIDGFYSLEKKSICYRNGRQFILEDLIFCDEREDEDDYFLVPRESVNKTWFDDDTLTPAKIKIQRILR